MLQVKFLFFSVLVVLFGTNNLLAQPTLSESGPFTNDQVNYTGKEEASVKERAEWNPGNTVQNPPVQTDEYGYYNFNAYLSGLGASGGYVAIPNAFNENVDGSIEAWIYPNATTSSAPCIAGKGDATNVGFAFYWVASSGNLGFRFGNISTSNTGGTSVPLNQWTHVACTWTGGAGNYTVTFYVNGAVSGAPVNNTGTWNVTSDSMTIGSIRAPFGGKNFYGFIDEVRYWQDQRTAAEIRDNRFVGIGDGANANSGNAITSSSHYNGCNAMYNFNVGGSAPDYIGGFNGYFRSVTAVYSTYAPTPMAYNYVCWFPDGTNDYIVIPDNSIFDQTVNGSIEAWIYLNAASQLNTIYHKGISFANTTLAFYITASNKVGINIGPHNYISAGPTVFTANRWYHVAATWSGGPNFTVRLYVNGVLDHTATFNLAMPTTADPVWIGRYYTTTGNFNGYIDEVRLWSTERSVDQIRQCMFASGRALLPDASLIAVWNFDGNLNNFSATTGINGSFSSGGTNNCRFSSYVNENTTGALGTAFIAHPTVINRFTTPNPFPAGYIIKTVGKPINDNQTTWDTINVTGSDALTSIEVFLSIQHTYCGDLDITLRAPNGQTRDLTSDNGSTGENILTIFVDAATNVTTAAFTPPWSHIAGPEAAMGTFGGTNIQGDWILSVADDTGGDTGILVGWGLRFNGAITNIEPVSGNIPNKFKLYQNYPNPFNPATTIRFDLAKNTDVKIRIYDILGREVKTVVNEFKNAGAYEVRFDASNIASGTYFYKIEAGDFVDVKKLVVVK